MICQGCGAVLNSGERFCPKCGLPAAEEARPEAETESGPAWDGQPPAGDGSPGGEPDAGEGCPAAEAGTVSGGALESLGKPVREGKAWIAVLLLCLLAAAGVTVAGILLARHMTAGTMAGDFRGMTWGMSKSEVSEAERVPLTAYSYEDGAVELYGYADDLPDFQGTELEFFYEFNAEEKLVFAGYTVTKEKSGVTPQQYAETLESRYGNRTEITDENESGEYQFYAFDGGNSVVEIWGACYEEYEQFTVWYNSKEYYKEEYPDYYSRITQGG